MEFSNNYKFSLDDDSEVEKETKQKKRTPKRDTPSSNEKVKKCRFDLDLADEEVHKILIPEY